MSATALLLKEAGWQVTGSDELGVYGPPVRVLERSGIRFALGYQPQNIPLDTDCFIIGRSAKLDPRENIEVRAAHESGKQIYTFPQMLGEITRGRENFVVAGSYGKSTTASIVAHALRHGGVDAGYFVGAEPVTSTWLPIPAKLGSAPTFVLEGDEYPSGHDDSRAKFMHLHPRDVLLTSIVHDHINIYPTLESYRQPFQDLFAHLPTDGLIVVCADEPGALALAQSTACRRVEYGLEHGLYHVRDIRYGATTHFTLYKGDAALGELRTKLLGAHNIENITGAAAYVLERELVSFEQLKAAIPDFKGVHRKLYNLTPESEIPVYEGFGSSYEKARSAIKAMLLHFGEKPLVIVFEPHTFGWRNRANLDWYDGVFEGATRVFVAPPETQGAATHVQLSHETILARIGVRALPYRQPGDVTSTLRGNEAVLILTSGDLGGTLEALTKEIGEKFV
jgi:UDP-N-acetylmuramate: L-alanyl-gamma-D-glutamyl-meso-diaminopimelate ligase